MKKVIMLVFLVLTTTVIWSEEKISGFGIEAELDYNSHYKYYYNDYNSDMIYNPMMIANLRLNFSKMLSSKLEINPFFSFGISLDIEEDDSNSDDSTTVESINFGLGTGLYYHFIQGKYIDLSTGGTLGAGIYLRPEDDDYFAYYVNLNFPIILDIKLSDCLIIRIQHNVAGVSYLNQTITYNNANYDNWTWEDETDNTTKSEIKFSSYHNRDFNLNIGFMFKF